jgi:hypothetical protein
MNNVAAAAYLDRSLVAIGGRKKREAPVLSGGV